MRAGRVGHAVVVVGVVLSLIGLAALGIYSFATRSAGETLTAAGNATTPGWSNGVANLTFPGDGPSFSLSSEADSRVASTIHMVGIAEVRPNGTVRNLASLTKPVIHWTHLATLGDHALKVFVNGSVPVTGGGGSYDELGSLDAASTVVAFVYQLNVSSDGTPSTVEFSFGVAQWPWANLSDSLGLEVQMGAAPSTHLATSASPNVVNEVATSTGADVARFFWSPNATATYNTSNVQLASVGAFQNFTNLSASVHFLFGAVPGGYQSLSYDPWLALNLSGFTLVSALPTVAAWVLSPTVLVAIAFGAGTAVILGVVAARRRRDSDEPDDL